MKRIVTFDKANQPYGFPQLDASGSIPSNVTASFALTASYAMNGGGATIDTGSLATTGSNIFTGVQTITGSNGILNYRGDTAINYPTLAEIHAKDDYPWLERFYNDTFSTSSAVMAYYSNNSGNFFFHNESTQSISINVNGYDNNTGLAVYEDKVVFRNNIEVSGSVIISGTLKQGLVVTASGNYSHAEGGGTKALGNYSHAEGFNSIASGLVSHAEGDNNLASGVASHAEGNSTTGSGDGSHAEGISTKAIGYYSHTEGYVTVASGYAAHAEGSATSASGIASHAEGVLTQTVGIGSHAEGIGTIASGSGQHASGHYNLHNNTDSLFIIGNGVDDANRSDVVRVEISGLQVTGSVEVSGSISVSGQSNFNNAVAVNDANMNLTNSSSLNLTSGSGIFIDSGSLVITTGSITLNGVTGDLRPYKVFTALVTQTGGSDAQNINSGSLTIGTTYAINDVGQEPPFTWDFTNVGAPNNDFGTFFVATGTAPNSWGNGQLSYNNGAPVVTVLENTIGNIWFTYNDAGDYPIKSTDLFTANKTFVINGTGCNTVGDYCLIKTSIGNTNTIGLNSSDVDTSANDNELFNTSIEIRVYN